MYFYLNQNFTSLKNPTQYYVLFVKKQEETVFNLYFHYPNERDPWNYFKLYCGRFGVSIPISEGCCFWLFGGRRCEKRYNLSIFRIVGGRKVFQCYLHCKSDNQGKENRNGKFNSY